MSRWSRWKAERAQARKVRQIANGTSEVLTLRSEPLQTAVGRFSGASCTPILPIRAAMTLMGRTAMAEVVDGGSLRLRVDDQSFDVAMEWSREGAELQAASLESGGQIVARVAEGDRCTDIHGLGGRLLCQRRGLFFYDGDRLIGDFQERFSMSGVMGVRLIREIEPLPVLLFAATRAVYVQPRAG